MPQEFASRGLHLLYNELIVLKDEPRQILYGVRCAKTGNVVDHIALQGRSELSIYVDNFPGEKKYFASNLPVRTYEDFENDVLRAGIVLTRKIEGEGSARAH